MASHLGHLRLETKFWFRVKAHVEARFLRVASQKLEAVLQCNSNGQKIVQNHELLLRPSSDRAYFVPTKRFPSDLVHRTSLSWELERERHERRDFCWVWEESITIITLKTEILQIWSCNVTDEKTHHDICKGFSVLRSEMRWAAWVCIQSTKWKHHFWQHCSEKSVKI